MSTQTITSPSFRLTSLSLPDSSSEDWLERKLLTLIEKIKSARALSTQEQKTIKWQEQVIHTYFPSFQEKGDWEGLSFALCDLLIDVIYSAVLDSSNSDEPLNQLSELEEIIKSTLEFILPSEINVDDFIHVYQHYVNEEIIFRNKLKQIEECFLIQQNEFFMTANKLNLFLKGIDSYHKKELLDINQEREKKLKDIYTQIDKITHKNQETNQKVLKYSKEMKVLSIALKNQEESSEKIYTQIKTTLQRL